MDDIVIVIVIVIVVRISPDSWVYRETGAVHIMIMITYQHQELDRTTGLEGESKVGMTCLYVQL